MTYRVRYVSSARARKLRKRGVDVWFSHWSCGRCVYQWHMPVKP